MSFSTHFPTFKRLFSRRVLVRFAFVLACLATVVGLFYAVENLRGQRAWNKYRRELEARGVPLDFTALWPKPVPDDQNFALTHCVKTWFEKPYSEDFNKRWKDNFDLGSKRVPSSWDLRDKRQFIDLVAWERAFAAIRAGELPPLSPGQEDFASNKLDLTSRAKAAPGVLEGLKSNEVVFAELRAASRRPFVRYPRKYSELPRGIAVPRDLWAVCNRLELRVCAALAAGHSEMAFEDVKLLLYLADSVKEDPLLMSQWDHIFLFRIAVQPIWEGLAEHAWSIPQLQELATRLGRYDFLANCQFGLDAERAGALWTIEWIRKGGDPRDLLGEFDGTSIEAHLLGSALIQFIGWTMPSGWYAWEKLGYCQLFQTYFRSGFDPSRKRVSPAEIDAHAAEGDRLYRENYPRGYFPGDWLRGVVGHRFAAAALAHTNNFHVIRRFCFTQATADQAAVACILEQYRLAHGQFPENLENLASQLISKLPKDAITGEPYKYRRTDDGQFILYSVGWNEKDDGGTVVLRKDGALDLKNGDWVWRYPPPR
jgi:hypothetical protein